MTVVQEEGPWGPREEEVLPLMCEHSLALEQHSSSSSSSSSSSGGSSSKAARRPLLVRLRGALKKLTPELAAIALVYFVQGILKLSSLAVTFFFKDTLKMEPAQMAVADTITNLPWAVKPLYGFITDSFPIAGMRRRPYLILAGLLGSASWLCMAGLASSVPSAVACITAAALSTAFADVVADSIVVQLARASPGATEGALQSMCWGAHAFGRVITAYLSGWLVGAWGPRPVFAATATFPLIVCASSCLIRESGRHSPAQHGGPAAAAAAGGYDLVASCEPQEQQQQQQGSQGRSAAAAAAGEGGGERGQLAVGQGSAFAQGSAQGKGLTPGDGVVVELDHRAGGLGDTLPAGMGRQGSAEVVRGSQLQGLVNHGSSSLQYLHHKQWQQGTPTATPTSAAAADGDGSSLWDGGSTFTWRGASLGVSGGSSKGKGSSSRVCLVQAWANVRASVGLFWNAVKQPHMLRPVVFLFLLLSMPQPDSAMFYFKTNKLGFDAEFFGRVKLVAALADLAGLAVYNVFLKTVRLRRLMLWGGLLGCAVGLTPLLLVEGVNRKLGVSDRLFAMVDSALLASIGQVLMMPTLVLCARLCPEGVEATLYASLMSLINAAAGTAALSGAVMMKVFGITSSNFEHLSALLLTCNLLSLLPLPLVGWVPDSSTKAAAAAGAAAAGKEEGEEACVKYGDVELGRTAAAATAAGARA